jgi:hypothetical protein
MARPTLSHALAALLLAVLAGPAFAASPLQGSWKQDPRTVELSKEPSRFTLADGKYGCSTCSPPISVLADGKDQPLEGHAPYETLAVKVSNPRTVDFTYKAAGKPTMVSRVVVAEDGKTMIRTTTRRLEDGRTTTHIRQWQRLQPATPGQHAFAGAWRAIKIIREPPPDSAFTIKIADNMLSMEAGGSSYQARLDGQRATVAGDPGTSEVSVTMPNPATMVEVSYRDGKPYLETTMTVQADGLKARVRWRQLDSNITGGFTAVRQ